MTLLVVCHRHDLSWDMDYDPPGCNCEDTDLLVFEDEPLPVSPPGGAPIDWASLLGVDNDSTTGIQ